MQYTSLPPGYLTTTLAAQAAGVQPATIRDWVRRGILHRAGGSTRHPIYTVDAVTTAQTAAKPNRPGQRAHR
ncbi:MerR family transcriptional regulator [Streptomyces sp. NBC_00582]|uniref:MerR family transcriptional regulator n=1 Tax=Streptomyces sp. NBC_00582 TaxID=2975783 RepID=UPI002E80FDE9|nr:MerR family transcriptional regulator [Streptomyces sp. NBC_00582]WUB64439.1 helix-turn-helix domain-containing protein [Streptomyces sp. NBC_00582]